MNEVNVPGDGDCLFHAFLEMGTPFSGVADFRNAVADRLQTMLVEGNETVLNIISERDLDIDDLLSQTREAGNYMNEAGEMAPQIIALALDANTTVIENMHNYTTNLHSGANGNYTLIRINENHFLATRPQS